MSDACPAVIRTEGYHLLWGKARVGAGGIRGWPQVALLCIQDVLAGQTATGCNPGCRRGAGVVSPGLATAQGVITKYRREKSMISIASNVTEAMWPEAHSQGNTA